MMNKKAETKHKGNGAGQRTIELTDYEAKRLKELSSTIEQLEQARQTLVQRLRQLDNFRLELAGRRSELVEMLADKHGFDPKRKFSLNENKLILKEEDNG